MIGLFLRRRTRHVDDLADLFLATQHRIDATASRLLGEIGRELVERSVTKATGMRANAGPASPLPAPAPVPAVHRESLEPLPNLFAR